MVPFIILEFRSVLGSAPFAAGCLNVHFCRNCSEESLRQTSTQQSKQHYITTVRTQMKTAMVWGAIWDRASDVYNTLNIRQNSKSNWLTSTGAPGTYCSANFTVQQGTKAVFTSSRIAAMRASEEQLNAAFKNVCEVHRSNSLKNIYI